MADGLYYSDDGKKFFADGKEEVGISSVSDAGLVCGKCGLRGVLLCSPGCNVARIGHREVRRLFLHDDRQGGAVQHDVPQSQRPLFPGGASLLPP